MVQLTDAVRSGRFQRLLLVGMGCSAICGDVLKSFLASEQVPLDVQVVNDYHLEYYLTDALLADPGTLVVITSYSGSSEEPLIAYRHARSLTSNIVVWTAGGPLGRMAVQDGLSYVQWNLGDHDREYPLFHVAEFFSSSLNILRALGVVSEPYADRLPDVSRFLLANRESNHAKELAVRLRDSRILFLGEPAITGSIVRIARMYLNEIAMMPSSVNLLHEFTHSEIASFAELQDRHHILLLTHPEAHPFERSRVERTVELLRECPSREAVKCTVIEMKGATFLERAFWAMFFLNDVFGDLAAHYDRRSFQLISRSSGNPWYNQDTIAAEVALRPTG
ncbi:SIS domain-containing protein [Lentzea sp. NPDC051208]|uniref:SIS domain-containing protein n=1 Tax=Lentzea sp. NPDC051208 TaxID=3154642 RepID=UPI0034140A91